MLYIGLYPQALGNFHFQLNVRHYTLKQDMSWFEEFTNTNK